MSRLVGRSVTLHYDHAVHKGGSVASAFVDEGGRIVVRVEVPCRELWKQHALPPAPWYPGTNIVAADANWFAHGPAEYAYPERLSFDGLVGVYLGELFVKGDPVSLRVEPILRGR